MRVPLPPECLPAHGHLRGHVLGLIPHPHRCGPGKNRPPGHSLSSHHQHIQQRHGQNTRRQSGNLSYVH